MKHSEKFRIKKAYEEKQFLTLKRVIKEISHLQPCKNCLVTSMCSQSYIENTICEKLEAYHIQIKIEIDKILSELLTEEEKEYHEKLNYSYYQALTS